jgi:hypothetical protein
MRDDQEGVQTSIIHVLAIQPISSNCQCTTDHPFFKDPCAPTAAVARKNHSIPTSKFKTEFLTTANPAGPAYPVDGVWGHRSTRGIFSSTVRCFPETWGLIRADGGYCPAWRRLPEVAKDRELPDPTNHTPPFTSDPSCSSAAIDIGCEAIQVESMNAAGHGGLKCHAGLAVSIRLFTIWKLFILFNASPRSP